METKATQYIRTFILVALLITTVIAAFISPLFVAEALWGDSGVIAVSLLYVISVPAGMVTYLIESGK
jgi:hypothetical protein